MVGLRAYLNIIIFKLPGQNVKGDEEEDDDFPDNCYHPKEKIFKFSLTWLAAYYYAPLLQRKSVKVCAMIILKS